MLDFVNSYEDMESAFSKYYTVTLLSNSVTPNQIYDVEAKIDGFCIIDPSDIEAANDLLYKDNLTVTDKKKLTFMFQKTKRLVEKMEEDKQREFVTTLKGFVRFYEFLLQATCFSDEELHKKYNFITCLLSYINIKHPGGGFSLDGKIQAMNFVQKKTGEHNKTHMKSNPIVKLPTADTIILPDDKIQKLSEIIAQINSRTGKNYDNDVVVKAMLQIRDIMLKSDKLKTSAKNNTVKNFELAYFDSVNDALIEGLSQNQDFFTLLLNDENIKKEILGIFVNEIYNSLNKAK